MALVLGRDGELVKSLRVVLEDVPDDALKGVLKGFSTVSLTVLLVASLTMSSSSNFSWWYGGVSVWGAFFFWSNP